MVEGTVMKIKVSALRLRNVYQIYGMLRDLSKDARRHFRALPTKGLRNSIKTLISLALMSTSLDRCIPLLPYVLYGLVALEEGKKIVGLAYLLVPKSKSKAHNATLGIVISEGYRGKGIGTLLTRAIKVYAKALGLSKISLEVDSDNEPAIKLYLKQGFKIEGVLKCEERVNDRLIDVYRMGLLLQC